MSDESKLEVRFFYWGRGLQATLWLWRAPLPSWLSIDSVRNGFWIKDDGRSGVAEFQGIQRSDSTMWVPPANIAAVVPIGDQHET